MRDLTVHHMIPRADGGHDDPSNLVSLCRTCHDYVEVNELRSRAAIMGSYDIPMPGVVTIEEKIPDDDWRPDWHKHVYGGVKRQKP